MRNELLEFLASHRQGVAIAFSGGVDSTLLAHLAHLACGGRALAITCTTPYIPKRQLEQAVQLAEHIGIRHQLLAVEPPLAVWDNPLDRCYHCKQGLLGAVKELAAREGYLTVMDGTNADDTRQYRPGRRALHEMGIVSPFAALGINKEEIRRLARQCELPNFAAEADTCLLTRLPYGQRVDLPLLERIERAESLLGAMGYRQVRVRVHGDLARIEVASEMSRSLFEDMTARRVDEGLRQLGFRHVCVDLGGYHSGCYDPKGQGPQVP